MQTYGAVVASAVLAAVAGALSGATAVAVVDKLEDGGLHVVDVRNDLKFESRKLMVVA